MLVDMEAGLMRLNTKNPAELASFLASVQKFASANTDAKSQAFCFQAGMWLSEQGVKDKSIVALLAIGAPEKLDADSDLKNAVYHYQNYFAVVNASRSSDGKLAFSEQPINKLTDILDRAQKNFLEQDSDETTTEKGRYYFLFANKAQADEFVESVLGNLPAKFNTIVGTVTDRLGKGYVQSKGIAGDAYAVEFTCEYTDKFPDAAPAALKPQSNAFIQPSFTGKRQRVNVKLLGESNAYNESTIKDYAARSNFQSSAFAQGRVEVSGTASLFYGQKYKIDLDKDSKFAKELATEAFRQLLKVKYNITLEEPLEKFLAGESGQKAIALLIKNVLDVQGWASMEVFAVMAGKECKNYDALKKAIIDNWQLAHDRADLVYSYIEKLNQSLSQLGKATIKISESDLKPNIYFFQDLPAELMNKLIGDKDISKNTALRDWLNVYNNAQRGDEHMDQLLTYLQANGGAKGTEYAKIKAALDSKDFALLNRYWQREQNDRLGMRNEMRDKQSLLVQAIENSGDGNSRSTMISSLTQAHVGLKIAKINYNLELEKGEKCSVEVEIKESRPVQDVNMSIKAYLVDPNGAVIPLAKQPNGKYAGEVGAAGDYTFVAYAQNDDGSIATRLVGEKINVAEKPEPPPEKEDIKYTQPKQVTSEVRTTPIVETRYTTRLPSSLQGAVQFDGSGDMIKGMIAAYATIGATFDWDYQTFSNVPSSLNGQQAVEFFKELGNQMHSWCNNPVNQAIVIPQLTNQADFAKFEMFLEQGKFADAASLLKEGSQMKNAFGSWSNYQDIETFMKSQDIRELLQYRIATSVGLNINLNKPTFMGKARKSELKNKITVGGEEISMSDKELLLLRNLKKNSDAVIFKKGQAAYLAHCAEDGKTLEIFRQPKVPKTLNIYLQDDLSVLVTGDKLNTITGGTQFISEINLKHFKIVPYVGLNVQLPTSTTKIIDDQGNSTYQTVKYGLVGNLSGGTRLEMPITGFLSLITDVGGTLSYSKAGFTPSAQTGYGVKVDLGKVDIEAKFNQSFMPQEMPENTVSVDASLQAGRFMINAGGSLYMQKNIKGDLPYGLRVGISYTLK